MGISVTKTKIHILHAIVFVYNFGLQQSQSYIKNYPSILLFFFSHFVTCIKLMCKQTIKGVNNNNTHLSL